MRCRREMGKLGETFKRLLWECEKGVGGGGSGREGGGGR